MLLVPQLLCLLGLTLGTVHAAPLAEVKLERGSCPMFWYSFNGRCYKYVSSPMTWGAAEQNCVSQDANLVSEHSEGEHNFVRTLIKNFDPHQRMTWIGLTDVPLNGWWMWSDGSRVTYTKWYDNSVPSGGYCAVTNYGAGWAEAGCSGSTRPSVCVLRTVCS